MALEMIMIAIKSKIRWNCWIQKILTECRTVQLQGNRTHPQREIELIPKGFELGKNRIINFKKFEWGREFSFLDKGLEKILYFENKGIDLRY